MQSLNLLQSGKLGINKLLLNYFIKFQPNKFCSHHGHRVTAQFNLNPIFLIQIPMVNVVTHAFLKYSKGIAVECMECLNKDAKKKKDRSCTLWVGRDQYNSLTSAKLPSKNGDGQLKSTCVDKKANKINILIEKNYMHHQDER